MCAKLLQSCLTLCDPKDCSPLSSSVHRILQARILDWVAISSFRGSSQPRNQTGIACISYIVRKILFNWALQKLAAAKSLQLCPTLYDPTDGSPPGSPIPGILQARTLEWVAISFSNAWKWKVKVKWLSHVPLLATPWTAAFQAPPSMGFFQARVLEWGFRSLPMLKYIQKLKYGRLTKECNDSLTLIGKNTKISHS